MNVTSTSSRAFPAQATNLDSRSVLPPERRGARASVAEPFYYVGVGFGLDESDVLDDAAWDHYHAYWRDLVDGLLESLGQVGEWPSWESTSYGDGLMPKMYRSICEGRSPSLDRAFSIQQTRPTEDAGPYVLAVVEDYVASLQDFPD